MGEQAAHFAQLVDDDRVGLPHIHATEERQRPGEHPVAHHRVDDLVGRHAIAVSGDEVIHAVGRRAVHDAGAGIESDVLRQIDRRCPIVKRMAEFDAFESRTSTGSQGSALQAVAGQCRLAQFAGDEDQPAVGIDERIREFRMHVQRLVGRNRPGRGGPDHRMDLLVRQRHQAECLGQPIAFAVGQGKADVDRGRLFVLILDFGLGQRRAAIETPIDRLESLEDEAGFEHAAERADLVGLGLVVHRQIGPVPVAEHAEANEIPLLPLDLFGRIGTAKIARLVGRQTLAMRLLDLVLNRQAVAVPARHIGRIETRQRLRADDDVLENLVDCVPDVDIAVGIGRTVVQDEARAARRCSADLFVQLALLPLLHPARLAPGQIAAHRERRVGKIEGLSVVGHDIRFRKSRASRQSRAICAVSASSESYLTSSRSLCRKLTRRCAS